MPRSDLDEAPSIERIRELHDHIDKVWINGRQGQLDRHFIDGYFGELLIEAPNTAARDRNWRTDPERMTTGEWARIIDLLGSFYVEWPHVGVQFTGEGKGSETQGEQAAKGLNEAIDQLNPAADSPWEHGVWQMDLLGRRTDLIVHGHAYYHDFPWIKQGEGEKEWAKRSAEWRRKAPLPILWFNLPAESTFPANLSTMDDEVLSIQTLSWLDLMDMFSEAELADSLPDKAEDRRLRVTLAIYANRQWLSYAIMDKSEGVGAGRVRIGGKNSDRILREIEHKMGRCAIRVLSGMTTGRKEPGYFWKSALLSVKEIIDEADKLLTGLATSRKFSSLPLFKLWLNEGGDNQAGAQARLEEFQKGGFLVLDAGEPPNRPKEDAEALFMPQFGQQDVMLFQFMMGRSGTMSGATESLSGTFGPVGQPAWSRNYEAQLAQAQLRPLTKAHGAAMIDIAESLSAAVVAFGESIPLAVFKDGKKGDIRLDPKKLADFVTVLTTEFSARVPTNRRADMDLGMSLMVQAQQNKVPLSFQHVFKELMGVEDFWEMYEQSLQFELINSDEVRKWQKDRMLVDLDVLIDEDQGMGEEEFGQVSEQLPPDLVELLRGRAQQGRNGGGAVSPATRGAVTAASPFSRQPGGPQPQEQAP